MSEFDGWYFLWTIVGGLAFAFALLFLIEVEEAREDGGTNRFAVCMLIVCVIVCLSIPAYWLVNEMSLVAIGVYVWLVIGLAASAFWWTLEIVEAFKNGRIFAGIILFANCFFWAALGPVIAAWLFASLRAGPEEAVCNLS